MKTTSHIEAAGRVAGSIGTLKYTKLAKVIAAVGFILGIFCICGGILLQFEPDARLLGLTIILSGIGTIIGSVLIGVLTEISTSVATRSRSEQGPPERNVANRQLPPSDPLEQIKWANREPPYDN